MVAIKPSVPIGSKASATKLPTKGSKENTDMMAMNMKNKPLKAMGCFQKVRMPWRTQSLPVLAGTTLSFMVQSVTGCATR